MKLKIFYKTLLWIIIFVFLLNIFTYPSISQEGDFEISITDKSYEIFKIDEINKIIHFNISITLKNIDSINTYDITVMIIDEDGNYTNNNIILPGKSQTFIFEDHPLIGLEDHEIKIYYYPTEYEIYIPGTKNHGEDVLTLKYATSSEENNTPGFEIIILIISIALFISIKRINKII